MTKCLNGSDEGGGWGMEDLITFQGMYEFTRPKKECIPHKYFFSSAYIFSLQEGKEVLGYIPGSFKVFSLLNFSLMFQYTYICLP